MSNLTNLAHPNQFQSYLEIPYYERITIDKYGRYKAELPQFPEVLVYARTLEDLIFRLNAAKISIFEHLIAANIPFPEPEIKIYEVEDDATDEENWFKDLQRRVKDLIEAGY